MGLASFALAGCAPFGPGTITAARPLYNEAIQQTEAQQLLLNIVRQRYNDPILFLDVTNISSGASRSINGNLLAKILLGGRDEWSESLGGSLSETPIIFYAPNNGEKFVRQILTPLDLRTVTLLLQAGWSIERLLLVVGDSINGLRNTADAPAEAGAKVAAYRDIVSAMRNLQRTGDMTVTVAPGANKDAPPVIDLSFRAEARATPDYQQLCNGLGFNCNDRKVQLRQGVGGGAGAGIATLATRSLFSAMFFLAQGVEAPEADIARGVVTANRGILEVNQSRGALFKVRTARAEPANAAVKVSYRNTWFYIDDTDVDSKTTFALLSILLTLQASDTNKITPLVTLPAM